jgi:hypothetical protein
MRDRQWSVFAVVLLGACRPMTDAREFIADELASTYSTAVRVDLPSPAGEGDAPLAGSLGPPEVMVEPEMPGTTTMTREGSSGPPMRSEAEPTPAPSHSTTRQYLRGHSRDAHRVRPGVRGPRPEPAPDYSPAE